MKPGIKETEFWLVVLLVVSGVGLALAGNAMSELLIGAGIAQAANYARGRVARKSNGHAAK